MKQMNIQDQFLNAARREKIPVTIIVTNGYQIKNAIISSFDSYSIYFIADGKQTLLFKHAVSSITLTREANLTFVQSEQTEGESR